MLRRERPKRAPRPVERRRRVGRVEGRTDG